MCVATFLWAFQGCLKGRTTDCADLSPSPSTRLKVMHKSFLPWARLERYCNIVKQCELQGKTMMHSQKYSTTNAEKYGEI